MGIVRTQLYIYSDGYLPTEQMDDLLVPSFQQIPYTELVKRIDEGSSGIMELSSMLYERKEINEKTIIFEQRMSKSSIFTHEIPTSTSERMLGFFKNFYIFVARHHIKSHKDFNDSVLKELDDLRIMRATTVTRTKQLVKAGLADIEHGKDALEKAKKTFAKAKIDYERSVEKLKNLERAVIEHQRIMEEKKKETVTKDPSKFSMGRMFQSAFEAHPEQDRDKQIKKVERRHDEMIHAANGIVERKKMLLTCMDSLDRYLQEAAAIFQELELDRMRRLKTMMRRFCESERHMLKVKEEQLAILEESMNCQMPEEDMLLFITQQKLTEATHKYGGAIKILDEYLYRKRDGAEWSFTTCDEFKVVDHAQLIASLTMDINNEATAVVAGTDVEPPERFAEYDTVDTAVPSADMTIHDILEEEKLQRLQEQETQEDHNQSNLGPADSEINSSVEKSPKHVSAKLKPLNDALELIFLPIPAGTEEKDAPHALTFGDWENLLQTEDARDHFLKVLDDKRCVSASLDAHGYMALAVAMQALLSLCEQGDDAKRAMRVLNMANTFYLAQDAGTDEDNTTEDPSPPLTKRHTKQYLQTDERLQRHPIWHKHNFWENALKEGVFAEMEKMEPTYWDELSPDGLNETIINIHNLIFGQLGTLSLTMREQSGLDNREVASHVLVMSRKFQLCEDQEFELLHSLTGQGIKEHQPPPVIPHAPLAHLDEHDLSSGMSQFRHSNGNNNTDVPSLGPNRTESNEMAQSAAVMAASASSPQSTTGGGQSSRKSFTNNQHHSNSSNSNNNSNTHPHHGHHHHTNRHSPSSSKEPVVEGTATVIGPGANKRHSGAVVAATVVIAEQSTGSSSVPVAATMTASASSSTTTKPSGQSSNPFSFMLGIASGNSDGGSGRRSRTASNNNNSNNHDDFFATL